MSILLVKDSIIPEWLPILVSLIGGGACGALINNFIQDRRNKKQSIRLGIELTPIFLPIEITENHNILVTFSGSSTSDKSYSYNNLYLVTLYFRNIGNKDLDKFEFKLSTQKKVNFIYFDKSTEGSMHEVTSEPSLSLSEPSPVIKFKFDPFNRKDEYTIKAYFSSNDEKVDKHDIKIDTKQPVNFRDRDQFSSNEATNKLLPTISVIFTLIALIGTILGMLRVASEQAEINKIIKLFLDK